MIERGDDRSIDGSDLRRCRKLKRRRERRSRVQHFDAPLHTIEHARVGGNFSRPACEIQVDFVPDRIRPGPITENRRQLLDHSGNVIDHFRRIPRQSFVRVGHVARAGVQHPEIESQPQRPRLPDDEPHIVQRVHTWLTFDL
jgi:hypothetical protein